MAFSEMNRCPSAWLLKRLSGSNRLRPLALKLALRLEGNQFYSSTARWIMAKRFGLQIGDYTYGECFVPGAFPAGVKIGRYVSIGPGVRVFLRNHPLDRLSTHPFFYNRQLGFVSKDTIDSGSLEIGHDAWIGAGVIILKGCSRIGIGAVIGASSIVTKDVPDFAVVAGNPAKVMRMRFQPEICHAIIASRWWEKPVDECVACLKDMTEKLDGAALNHPLLLSK
jgi:acetyltransferase-like isoleucine patch superfamily enzyme